MKLPQVAIERERPSAELAKALKDIKRSDLQLRTMIDALPAHAWASHADGSYIYCNQQWLNYSGFTEETVRGRTYREMIHPDDVGSFVKRWDELSIIGATIEVEARL